MIRQLLFFFYFYLQKVEIKALQLSFKFTIFLGSKKYNPTSIQIKKQLLCNK